MRIVIASDSHKRNDRLKMIEEAYPEADLYLHAGDYTVKDPEQDWIYVSGNNDPRGEEPQTRVISAGKHKIYMVHSHQFKKSKAHPLPDRLSQEAKNSGCDIAIYGHSHIPDIEMKNGVLILNPGSVARAGRGAKKGFILLDFDGDDINADWIDWDQFENQTTKN